jgi:GDP-L-fucose synthase
MGDAYREEYGLEVEHIIPSNLYGPHDHFDTVTGHVIPSMIAKFSRAQAEHETEVKLWGTGQATRDFLHVADAARGIAALAESGTSDGFPINLGSGRETRISLLAEIISNFYGGRAKPVFTGDVSDGVPRRLLDTGRAWRELKWRPSVRLEEGLAGTIAWYEDWDV